MANLKIKKGVQIYSFGPDCKPFTSEDTLTQEQVDYLAEKHSDQLAEMFEEEKTKAKK